LPSASAQVAFAAGLGRAGFSAWAYTGAAGKLSVRHPTARTANRFRIISPPLKLPDSIEPDLRVARNIGRMQPDQTD